MPKPVSDGLICFDQATIADRLELSPPAQETLMVTGLDEMVIG